MKVELMTASAKNWFLKSIDVLIDVKYTGD